MNPLLYSLCAALLPLHPSSATSSTPPVILSETGVKNLGIETVRVESADFEITAFALGRTEAIPESRAILSSRIPGRVVENRLKIGSFVRSGDRLVRVESRQPGDPPPAIWLTAPASGTVISVNTKLGAPVEPSDSLAETADLRSLYLIATLPQATAGNLKPGTLAKVHFPVRPGREAVATLRSDSPYLCPDALCTLGQGTSTPNTTSEFADLNRAAVVFVLENPDHQLRPDMNAECSIIMEKRSGVISVPREALHGSAANRHVYVKHAVIPNAFVRVNVHTGQSNRQRVEILDGLSPGDEVVTRGSYSLGFAGSNESPSLKQALDASHGHEHREDGSCSSSTQAGSEPEEHHHDPEETSIRAQQHQPAPRELTFIASTCILAMLLLVTSLRRRHANNPNRKPS